MKKPDRWKNRCYKFQKNNPERKVYYNDTEHNTDRKNRLLDFMGEGEGGMI